MSVQPHPSDDDAVPGDAVHDDAVHDDAVPRGSGDERAHHDTRPSSGQRRDGDGEPRRKGRGGESRGDDGGRRDDARGGDVPVRRGGDAASRRRDHTQSGNGGGGDEDSGGGGGPWPVPQGLDAVPAGADLLAMLEDIPIAGVSGRDTVEVMKAAYRQATRDRALFLLCLLETGMRVPGSADTLQRVQVPGEFAPEEARAALVWSRSRAGRVFGFAYDIHHRLPMLGQAMLAGVLDEPRAQAFVSWTDGLDDDQAGYICAFLLPDAPGMTVAELIDAIKKAAIAIDPEFAEKKYRKAIRGRRVVGSRNPGGSANVAGYDLPIDRAAAACERIDVLARACKKAGDTRKIDHIRVDLFLGMLDGSLEDLDEDQIITHILNHPFTDDTTTSNSGGTDRPTNDPDNGTDDDHGHGDDPDSDDGDGSDPDGSGGSDDGSDPDGSGGSDDDGGPGDRSGGSDAPGGASGPDAPDDDNPGDDGSGGGDAAGDGGPGSGGGRAGRGSGQRGGKDDSSSARTSSARTTSTNTSGPHDDAGTTGPAGQTDTPGTRTPGTRTAGAGAGGSGVTSSPAGDNTASAGAGASSSCPGTGVSGWSVPELRIGLASLLGVDEYPGEIPAWDFVPAAVARRIAARMHSAQWRFAICNDDGQLIQTGITTARPRSPDGQVVRRDARRGGILELHVTISMLARLATLVHTDANVDADARVADEPAHAQIPVQECARWAAVITDLARQHTTATAGETTTGTHTGSSNWSDTGTGSGTGTGSRPGPGSSSRPGAEAGSRSGSGAGTGSDDDAGVRRRRAGAGLRRHIQIRDRCCTHPTCRMPAVRADQDHEHEFCLGGLTVAGNLACLCRHDHRLRHDGGWKAHRPDTGTTIWHSPLGHRYTNRAPAIIPTLPNPRPATDEDGQDSGHADQASGSDGASDGDAGHGSKARVAEKLRRIRHATTAATADQGNRNADTGDHTGETTKLDDTTSGTTEEDTTNSTTARRLSVRPEDDEIPPF
ncbi:HNH endonuclease signature motif containing protein [Phytoactinopolyspora halotolerans]|uniref:DUF222 domain-containing protein n=1 Tax=Phytoactinopolyspora halotolerans TaxID=1981512 RepID=A0A6L9S8K5_9ACTN|nr:HNH endonuclease signature motif containing protein [Phytoactinopolyspora halotolerans]NEE01397.1 DUF222 domain-containing protein [Phytoactinopolyspora halotolerans]